MPLLRGLAVCPVPLPPRAAPRPLPCLLLSAAPPRWPPCAAGTPGRSCFCGPPPLRCARCWPACAPPLRPAWGMRPSGARSAYAALYALLRPSRVTRASPALPLGPPASRLLVPLLGRPGRVLPPCPVARSRLGRALSVATPPRCCSSRPSAPRAAAPRRCLPSPGARCRFCLRVGASPLFFPALLPLLAPFPSLPRSPPSPVLSLARRFARPSPHRAVVPRGAPLSGPSGPAPGCSPRYFRPRHPPLVAVLPVFGGGCRSPPRPPSRF